MRAAIGRERQAAAIGDLADIANENRLAGHPGQQHVEVRREPDRRGLGATGGLVLRRDMGVELGDLLRAQRAGQMPDHQPLQLDPDVESVARLLESGRRHHRNPVAAQIDQPFAGQLAQRLPCDRATDAEPFAERVLGQLVARRQSTLDDRPPDGEADPIDPAGGIP